MFRHLRLFALRHGNVMIAIVRLNPGAHCNEKHPETPYERH